MPPWGPGYGALPYVVGGGTRLYQGMAWRLTPEDFHLATTHGVPEGSSLADWPFDYDELEPFYTRVEQEIGVSGDGSAHRNQGARSAAYPMPPLPDNTEAQVLRRGAEKLGLATGPVPMLINSVPRAGRGPVRAVRGVRRLRLPERCQERALQHPAPRGAWRPAASW